MYYFTLLENNKFSLINSMSISCIYLNNSITAFSAKSESNTNTKDNYVFEIINAIKLDILVKCFPALSFYYKNLIKIYQNINVSIL